MHGRARADEPLVIEIRAAESAHEEVVGERVFLRPFPQAEVAAVLAAVVVAHRPAADLRHRSVHVVPAARDLLLVVIEGVHRARDDLVLRHVHGRRIDPERPVRHHGKARIRRPVGDLPSGEAPERLPVVVELGLLFRSRVRDAVRPGKHPVQIVEAVVLRVDHDDVPDPRETRVGRSAVGGRATVQEQHGRKRCEDRWTADYAGNAAAGVRHAAWQS